MEGITFIKIQPKYFSKGDIIADYSPLLPDTEYYEVINVYNYNIHLRNVKTKQNMQIEPGAKSYWYCLELHDGMIG